jgi:type II secretory pathway pseudopilin PulG
MKKAFTLVEMLIVVGIIIILTVGVFSTSYVFRDQLAFKGAYENAMGLIHEARSMALSSQSYPDTTDYDKDGLTAGDLILPNGYLVNFDASGTNIVVSLYADLFSSTIGELDEKDQLIKTITLADNILMEATGYTQIGNETALPESGKNFSLLYTTPDGDFFVVGLAAKNSVQMSFTQVDEKGTEKRTKYIFMQYLYGIPELMNKPYK